MLRKIEGRPCYTIAVVLRKGGVGKTTVAINLAAELVLRGYNVGIIDMDSQSGNATLFLGMMREDGLFHALVGVQQSDQYLPLPLGQVVHPVPVDSYFAPQNIDSPEQIGSFYIIPSASNTFRIPFMLPDLYRFHDLVADFYEQYNLDFVVIDNAPSLSMLDGAVYDVADGFLCVVEAEIGAISGLEEVYEQVERASRRRVRSGRRPCDILGIVPNKVRNLREHVDNINAIAKAFPGEVLPVIRLLKSYSKASKYGQTIRAFAPNSVEALEILELVDRVEEEIAQCLVR